jgi:hypothetical protein
METESTGVPMTTTLPDNGAALSSSALLSAILRWAEAKRKMHGPCPVCDLDESGQDCRCSEYNVKLNEAEAALLKIAADNRQLNQPSCPTTPR